MTIASLRADDFSYYYHDRPRLNYTLCAWRGSGAGGSSLTGANQLLHSSRADPADGEAGAPGQKERNNLAALIEGGVIQACIIHPFNFTRWTRCSSLCIRLSPAVFERGPLPRLSRLPLALRHASDGRQRRRGRGDEEGLSPLGSQMAGEYGRL